MHGGDNDVFGLDLDFLNLNLFPNTGYMESYSYSPSVTKYYQDCGRDGTTEEEVDCFVVENDEVIAHALQEEYSQLADSEASGNSHAEEEHSKASVFAQDWISPVRTYNTGREETSEEGDSMEPSSSCSSSDVYGEGDGTLELADDYSTLDGEVEKRLNQMVSIRHVPRINGEIPSVDEATSDHQRLLHRLKLYELAEFKVQGDGNCQFRALSDQFYRTPDHHKFVRQQLFEQLKIKREVYEGYVPMQYDEYLQKISKDGEWGDHVTLQAAADSYGVKIFVITSFKDTCYIEILPSVQKSNRIILLSFWAEVHYNSIYPGEDLPILAAKKKKRWSLFGNKH